MISFEDELLAARTLEELMLQGDSFKELQDRLSRISWFETSGTLSAEVLDTLRRAVSSTILEFLQDKKIETRSSYEELASRVKVFQRPDGSVHFDLPGEVLQWLKPQSTISL